ncbi:UdgX family uracil-DNA binding protein [Altererythrobacter aurantiacus]|uniref:Type-4 uracil-DNA glycosylase n=1 Tax=Parapontixanthobacter aurantiacus TaxID=1463599 RepID=A0A844ZHG5_9SPHN|nr:UdgX family uracil-DNA binding protein [Parapontixanthobacter aurantiacus]MXO85169.1 UdgX family uracil-DNA binding protein [Parapontixanthobacter aurantiacus]
MTGRGETWHRRYYSIHLSAPDDFEEWRDKARRLVQCGIKPDQVIWIEPGGNSDLFSVADGKGSTAELPDLPDHPSQIRVSKRFMAVAKNASLHSDPERFALLYGLLWRLQTNGGLMEDKTDDDVRRLEEMDKNVRRDSHKMHAFVRFREVESAGSPEGRNRYVAWFEPEHHIVRANAGFFVRRFTNMQWSILTPKGSLHWDGEILKAGPGASITDAPDGDPVEELWRRYYASIFNPARLKVGAMLSEMPKKYWKNLPEAELIPALISGAQKREAEMVATGEREELERPDTLDQLDRAIHGCTNCPIGLLENEAVAGEGPADKEAFSGLMIVGEQPGDQEDRTGKPFVGPAGQLLDGHLERAGIDRKSAYVTNAVKHFKYVQRGKRRIHQSPGAKEIDTCRWWLESETDLVDPKLILSLGASAARAFLGKTVSITKVRGEPIKLDGGRELWATVHPSYLLRLDGEAADAQAEAFQRDLARVSERLRELA